MVAPVWCYKGNQTREEERKSSTDDWQQGEPKGNSRKCQQRGIWMSSYQSEVRKVPFTLTNWEGLKGTFICMYQDIPWYWLILGENISLLAETGLLEIKSRSFKVCLLVDVIAYLQKSCQNERGGKWVTITERNWRNMYLSEWEQRVRGSQPRHSAVWFYFFGTGKKAQRVLNQTKEAKWF